MTVRKEDAAANTKTDKTTDNTTVTSTDPAVVTEPTRGDASRTDRDGATGYHCGICGQPIGAEGQHYNNEGEQVTASHANTMVVADNWPELQDAQDADKAEQANDTK